MTQLKIYTDQNIQSEVVPLETTQTRLVSDRNINFTIKISAQKHPKKKKKFIKVNKGNAKIYRNVCFSFFITVTDHTAVATNLFLNLQKCRIRSPHICDLPALPPFLTPSPRIDCVHL